MSSTLLRKSASPPTIAKSFAHALMTALRVSFGLSFESMKSTTRLRPATPPSLFTTLAHARTASTDFWNRPGCTGVSTSAITARRIWESVIPTSSAFGFALCAPATVAAPTTIATTTATLAIVRENRTRFPPGLRSAKFVRPVGTLTCRPRRSAPGAEPHLRLHLDADPDHRPTNPRRNRRRARRRRARGGAHRGRPGGRSPRRRRGGDPAHLARSPRRVLPRPDART